MVLDISGVYQPQSLNPTALNTLQQNQESSNASTTAFNSNSQSSAQSNFSSEAASVSLSSFDSERTGFLTESDIINGINAALGDTGIRVEEANPDDFTPEAVADRILNQVSSIIEQFAGTPEEANEILQQAREGINNGIAQARDTLDALGALNETTESTIQDTESFIEEGLAALEESLSDLFEQTGVVAEQEQPQPEGEEQVIQTQTAQTAQGASLAQAQAEADERARVSF